MKFLFLFLATLLFLKTKAQRKDTLYDGASAFKYGFARVEKGDRSFYIDKNNQLAFDTILKIYHPTDSIMSLGDGFENLTKDKEHVLIIIEKNHKKGLIDDYGNWILHPIYDTLQIKWNNYLQLKIGNKMTYANTWGKKILPLEFEDVGIMDGNYFDVKLNEKWGIYSVSDGKMVIPFDYQEFDYCGGCTMGSNYVFAKKDNKWGVVDFRNNVLVPFDYRHTHWRMRSDQWVTCFKKGDYSVVINIALKKEYSDPEYSDMEIIDNLLRAKKNDKYGLINGRGKTVVDFIYDAISDPYDNFHSGPYLLATKNKKMAIIDTLGKVIVPFGNYDFIGIKGGYFVLNYKNKVGLADSSGKILLPIEYEGIEELNLYKKSHEVVDAFELEKDDQYGFFLPKRNKFVAPKYSSIKGLGLNFDNGENILLEGDNKNNKELFNANGDKIYTGNFDEAYLLSDNLIQLDDANYLNGLYNIEQQKMVLPMSFIGMDICQFDKGVVILDKHPKNKKAEFGLYDTAGKVLLPLTDKVVRPLDSLHYGLIADNNIEIWNRATSKAIQLHYNNIRLPNKFGLCILLDSLGNFLYNFRTNAFIDTVPYNEVKAIKNGCFELIKAQKNNTLLYGYADTSGKIIVPPIYNAVFVGDSGRGFLVQKGDRFGICDTKGNVVLNSIYQNIILDESPNFHTNTVKFSFPILATKDGSTFRYFDALGKRLLIISKAAIGFFPSDDFGIGNY